MTDRDTDESLRDYLEALPLPEPSDALFDRIERTRGRRKRVRQTAIGAVATLVLAIAIVPMLLPMAPTVDPLLGQANAPDISTPDPSLALAEAELRLIDRQLATAYSVSAPEGHIDTLWQRREAAILKLEKEPVSDDQVISL